MNLSTKRVQPFIIKKLKAETFLIRRIQAIMLLAFFAFLKPAHGIVIDREWEATINLPATAEGLSGSPQVYEFEKRTLVLLNVKFPTNDTRTVIFLLDENHNQISSYTAPLGVSSLSGPRYVDNKFTLRATTPDGLNGRYSVVFYEEQAGAIVKVGDTADFAKPDEVTSTTHNSGGFALVQEHEDYPDARFKELDRTLNASSMSLTAISDTSVTLRVRHYLFSGDSTPQEPTIVPMLIGGVSGSNYIARWDSEFGKKYRVQVSSDLETWVARQPDLDGTGSPLQWAEPLEGGATFVRVMCIE